MTSHEFDRAIDALARRQHGAFSHRQAGVCGGTYRMIRRRRDTGQWLDLAAEVSADRVGEAREILLAIGHQAAA